METIPAAKEDGCYYFIDLGRNYMQINNLLRKCLAVGIILLFVGVAVTPSINFNVVKASNDNDLVEVTTQACGIKGFGNTTVQLTRQQYQNLEQYLVEFRARLNKTTTNEEAVPIFKEAVLELNNYGLLPKGMSIKKAQKLVTTGYLNEKAMNLLQNIYRGNRQVFNNESNNFCLIAGVTNQTVFTGALFTTCYLAALFTVLRMANKSAPSSAVSGGSQP